MVGVLCDIYGVVPAEIAIGVELGEDVLWHQLVKAGLERKVVSGIVWFEQMLDHGSSHLESEGGRAPEDVGPDE